MLLSRIFASIWLVFLIFFFVITDNSIGVVLLLLTFILALLLMLNMLVSKNKVTIDLSSSGTVHKGDAGFIHLEIKNDNYFPVPKIKLTLEINNHLTGENTEETLYVAANVKSTQMLAIQLQSELCGALEVKVTSMTYYDFLGIFAKEFTTEEQTNLYVLPRIYNISLYLNEQDGLVDEEMLFHTNRKGQDGLEIFGLKEYSPGDNVKNIHWNMTSKFDEIIVKELTEEVTYNFLVLVDLTVLTDTTRSALEIDAMMEATVSISKAILNEGYAPTIAWLDPLDQIIRLETVTNEHGLNLLMRKLLTISQVKTKQTLLDDIIVSGNIMAYSNLVYVSTHELDMTDASLPETVHLTTLLCSENETNKVVSGNDLVQFNPEEIEDQLRILTI